MSTMMLPAPVVVESLDSDRATRVPLGTALAPVLTSAEWLTYYRANNEGRLAIPWHEGAGLTPEEVAEVVPSLRAWQLGETSDGAHLLKVAARYARQVGDPLYPEVILMFIREEQRHGALLGQFLDLAGVPRATHDWGDSLFRFVRYALPRLELWVTPVIMVETLAVIYYAAVQRATGSTVLRRICEQILLDEVPHIRFQCERLATLHRDRSPPLQAITMAAHRVFFAAMVLVVWVGHRRALRAGGYSFRRYWRASWTKMRAAWRKMNPARYRWPEMPRPPGRRLVDGPGNAEFRVGAQSDSATRYSS